MATKKSPTQQMFVDDDEEVQKKPTKKAAQPSQKDSKEETKGDVLPSGENFLELPSKGLLGYPSYVTYRDILVKDEEKLSLATGETYAKTLNSVLKSIVNDCSWFEDMTIYDRDYALVWLWANNYDSKKSIDMKCTSCEHEETVVFDLQDAKVDDVKDNVPVPFAIPVGAEGKKENIYVRLNTVGDEIAVENFLSTGNNRDKHSFEHLMMVSSIGLEFNMPFANKIKWVGENLRGADMGYVRKFHQYFRYGVQDTIEHNCSECGEVTLSQIPFSAQDVLFPTTSDNFDELLQFNESAKDKSD